VLHCFFPSPSASTNTEQLTSSIMPKTAAPLDVITLEDTEECAQKLLEAAKTLGFVYITLKGTDITPQKVSEMFEIVGTCSSYAQDARV
jgi:hypothetical protein